MEPARVEFPSQRMEATADSATTFPLLQLPPELQAQVIGYLEHNDILNLSATCSSFYIFRTRTTIRPCYADSIGLIEWKRYLKLLSSSQLPSTPELRLEGYDNYILSILSTKSSNSDQSSGSRISALRSLTLELGEGYGEVNLSHISQAFNLRSFSIRCKRLDIKICSYSSGVVRDIRIQRRLELDLSPISRLTGLEELEIHQSELQGLKLLRRLQKLKSLTLKECLYIRDVRVLRHLTGLTSLDLSCCSGLRSLKGIETLTSLTSLDLSNCDGFHNFDEISELKQLKTLDMGYINFGRLKFLRGLCLRSLRLKYSSLRYSDLEFVTTLEELDISGTRIGDLEFTAKLPHLRKIDISWCYDLGSLGPLVSSKIEEVVALVIWCYLDDLDLLEPGVRLVISNSDVGDILFKLPNLRCELYSVDK